MIFMVVFYRQIVRASMPESNNYLKGNTMASTFISYSSRDTDRVKDFVSDLKNLGQDVWFDDALSGGQEWWDTILSQMEEADVFIMIITSHYMASDACRREYQYAISLDRNIIPVVLGKDLDLSLLPPLISKLQMVDYSSGDKSSVFSLNRAINSLPDKIPLPDPMPSRPEIPISYVAGIIEDIRSSEALSYDQQIAIVFKLRSHLEETDDIQSVQKALDSLANRNDLLAKVKQEMDRIPLMHQRNRTEKKSEPPVDLEPLLRKPREKISNSPVKMTPIERSQTRIAGISTTIPRTKRDSKGIGFLGVICFFIPIVGLVLAGVWWSESPSRAKKSLWIALAGMFIYFIINLNSAFYY